MNKIKQLINKIPVSVLKGFVWIAIFILFAQMYHYFFSLYKIQFPIAIHLNIDFSIERRPPVVSKFISPINENSKARILQQGYEIPEIKDPTGAPAPSPKEESLKIDLVKDVIASDVAIDLDGLFEKVRILESGKGTALTGHHVYCREAGLWNEIGYGNRQGTCFESMEEGKETLLAWYQNKFERGMTLAQAMCYWESGTAHDTCKYYQDYLKLN